MSVNEEELQKLNELLNGEMGEGSLVVDAKIEHTTAIPDWVYDINPDEFDVYHFAVLAVIKRHGYGRKLASFPSYPTLARECFCSLRTIKNKVSDLAGSGLILKLKRMDKAGDQTSNLYVLCGPEHPHGKGLDLIGIVKKALARKKKEEGRG